MLVKAFAEKGEIEYIGTILDEWTENGNTMKIASSMVRALSISSLDLVEVFEYLKAILNEDKYNTIPSTLAVSDRNYILESLIDAYNIAAVSGFPSKLPIEQEYFKGVRAILDFISAPYDEEKSVNPNIVKVLLQTSPDLRFKELSIIIK